MSVPDSQRVRASFNYLWEADQDDLPLLLRRLAGELVPFGEIRVVDLILHSEITDDGLSWPSITVYFERTDDEDDRLPV